MKYFLFEVRESDGNDCDVTDCVVTAESKEKAWEAVDAHYGAIAEKQGWESDGDSGYYFPDEGGLTIAEPEEYATDNEMQAALRYYHCHFYLEVKK